MKTLLQKAKELELQKKPQRSFSKEEHELVISLLNGEVNLTQVKKVTKIQSVTSVYVWAFRCLQDYLYKTNTKI